MARVVALHEVELLDAHPVAARGDAEERRTRVGTGEDHPRRDPIALGDEIFHRHPQVGKRRAEHRDDRLQVAAEVALLVGELVAVDRAGREALVDHGDVAGGESLLEDAAHGLLVRVGVHCAPPDPIPLLISNTGACTE